MQKLINKSNLQLEFKCQQILCKKHNQNIVSLDISQNIDMEKRVFCRNCITNSQQILQLSHVEDYLYKRYEKQQETMSQLRIEFNKQKHQLNEFLKLYPQFIQQIQLKLNCYSEKLTQLNQKNSKSKLFRLIQDIATSNTTNLNFLEEIAIFMNNECIINGKLNLEEKLKFNVDHDLDILEQIIQFETFLENSELNNQQKMNTIVQVNEQEQQITLNINLFKKIPIQLNGHNKNIGAVAISNNDQLIASGDHSGLIILWDLPQRLIKQKYNGEKHVQDLIFSPDDKLLAAAQYDSPFNILIFNLSSLSSTSPLIKLEGHIYTVMRIVFTSNQQFLISGSVDNTLKIWSLHYSKYIVNQKLSFWVYGVNISFDQQYISVCCLGGQAYLFDSSYLQNLGQIAQWQAHDESALGTIFTQDSKMLLTCGEGAIKLWSILQLSQQDQQKYPLKVYKTESNDSIFWSISIRLNNSILISNDDKIRIWDLQNDQLIQTLDVPNEYHCLNDKNFAVSSDMKYIITGGMNEKLKVYELQLKSQ